MRPIARTQLCRNMTCYSHIGSPSVSKAASYSYYASDRKQRLQRIFVELEQRYKSEGHDLR